MKKKYNNLNEEINRIKSLFSEERLYGNLKDNKLLIEQGIGRRIGDSLSKANNAISKAIKNIDPKIATKFLNSNIDSFEDLSDHLNLYNSLWRSMGINWEFTNDAILALSNWQKNGKLKSISDKDMLGIINDLPTEGDIRGIVFDLWRQSKGGTVTPRSENVYLVKKSDNGDIILQAKTNVLNGIEVQNSIDTYKLENDELVMTDAKYTVDMPKKDVDEFLRTVDESMSKVTTDEINADGNPDVIKGEIINSVEDAIDGAKGKTPKEITADELQVEILKGGKTVVVRTPDGKTKVINAVEMVTIEVDEVGNVKVTDLKGVDVTPKGDIVQPSKYTEKISKFRKKMGEVSIGQGLRWVFPTASSALKIVSLYGPGSKFYSKQRFSFVDNVPGKGGYADIYRAILKSTVELPIRLIAEQVVLISLNEAYMSYKRGGVPKDESLITTSLNDYWQSNLWKFHPLGLIPNFLKVVYEDVADLKKDAYSACRGKCQKKMSAEEVEGSECFKECKKNVDELFSKRDEFVVALRNFQKEYGNLNNINEWEQQDIEDFCNNKEGNRDKILENINTLKQSIQNLEGEVDKQFKSEGTEIEDKKWILKILKGVDYILPGDAFSSLPTREELINKFLPKATVDGQPLNVQKLTDLENKLNQACADYWAEKRRMEEEGGGSTIVDPDDYENVPEDNKEINKEELENMFGYIEVVAEPIEIV